jgi:hypothetical protein
VVHVEQRRLIVGVGREHVGVVAEQQPQIGRAAAVVGGIGIAHGHAVGVGEPAVAGDPDVQRLRRARRGMGLEEMIRVVAFEHQARRPVPTA